jgi:hypothetical protein
MHTEPTILPARSALASLRRYTQFRVVLARCELCSEELTDDHPHILELSSRRLCCACETCAILFANPAATRYRSVSRRKELLADIRLTDLQWQGLRLPINLAFFVFSTPAERVVALYPSSAGTTEALPPPDAWDELVRDNPVLRDMEPDVEALLVNRLGEEPEHYLVGIDECYTLVGLVRMHWRGLSGGTEVWREIGRFFAELKQRSRQREVWPHD